MPRVPEQTATSGSIASPPGRVAARRAPHPVFWVIAGCLVVIAWQRMFDGRGPDPGAALAQATTAGGLRGVYSFTGPLSKDTYGVYMVDVDSMTIWCYAYSREEGCLRLAGARSWKYDRYLENYNNCGIPPEKVRDLVENQRAYRMESDRNPGP